MVETPRLEAKRRLCKMVSRLLMSYPSWDLTEADHEYLNNGILGLSFPRKRESRTLKKKTGFLPAQE